MVLRQRQALKSGTSDTAPASRAQDAFGRRTFYRNGDARVHEQEPAALKNAIKRLRQVSLTRSLVLRSHVTARIGEVLRLLVRHSPALKVIHSKDAESGLPSSRFGLLIAQGEAAASIAGSSLAYCNRMQFIRFGAAT